MRPEHRIRDALEFLYDKPTAERLWKRLRARLEEFKQAHPNLADKEIDLSQDDAILITYADQVRSPDRPPLETLALFLEERLEDSISGVHLLPFFPYSSDDGFSVIDYRQVDPLAGSWQDIHRLGRSFRLMFDAVINHISRESAWFQAFRRGEAPYTDFFITVEPEVDLSMVVRPRALPLLTEVETDRGPRHVWTTFSEDQIDLNYASPDLMYEIIDLLLFYVSQGAEIIRLDAIAYLWKEPGTASIHLPQTHAVVKLWRAVLDAVAPGVILITETNVPHEENISYFGSPLPDGRTTDEAQMVYQFPLAPLVLHTFHTADTRILRRWAQGLETPAPQATFFNFIASHDGIGVRPAEGILSPEQIQSLVDRTLAHGGEVSYKTNQDGSRSVYELNITLYDMLNDPEKPEPEMDAARFLASQFVMLSMIGVPGIYFHSLFGARNCRECVEKTGRSRSINREKFRREALESLLRDATSPHAKVFIGYRQLLQVRKNQPAFHPSGSQRVVDAGSDSVLAMIRTSPREDQSILCLVNVSERGQNLSFRPEELGLESNGAFRNLVSGEAFSVEGGAVRIHLAPYQYCWLAKADKPVLD